MTAGFLVAGVYAVGWLRGRRDRYHRLGFIVPFTVAAIVTPIQMALGDGLARSVFREQPAKFAAIEIVWTTGTEPGRVPLRAAAAGRHRLPAASRSPGWTRSWPGSAAAPWCTGLSEVPADDRPTAREATIAHWAFDTMVGIATAAAAARALVRAGLAAAA